MWRDVLFARQRRPIIGALRMPNAPSPPPPAPPAPSRNSASRRAGDGVSLRAATRSTGSTTAGAHPQYASCTNVERDAGFAQRRQAKHASVSPETGTAKRPPTAARNGTARGSCAEIATNRGKLQAVAVAYSVNRWIPTRTLQWTSPGMQQKGRDLTGGPSSG